MPNVKSKPFYCQVCCHTQTQVQSHYTHVYESVQGNLQDFVGVFCEWRYTQGQIGIFRKHQVPTIWLRGCYLSCFIGTHAYTQYSSSHAKHSNSCPEQNSTGKPLRNLLSKWIVRSYDERLLNLGVPIITMRDKETHILYTHTCTLHICVHTKSQIHIPREAVATVLAGQSLPSVIPATTSVGASGWLLIGLPTVISCTNLSELKYKTHIWKYKQGNNVTSNSISLSNRWQKWLSIRPTVVNVANTITYSKFMTTVYRGAHKYYQKEIVLIAYLTLKVWLYTP